MIVPLLYPLYFHSFILKNWGSHLTLHSDITSGSAQGAIWDARDHTQVSHNKEKMPCPSPHLEL